MERIDLSYFLANAHEIKSRLRFSTEQLSIRVGEAWIPFNLKGRYLFRAGSINVALTQVLLDSGNETGYAVLPGLHFESFTAPWARMYSLVKQYFALKMASNI